MFRINVRKVVGDVTVIDCQGNLFAGFTGDATRALREVVTDLLAENCRNLLLNFKDLTGVDSGGIGMLISVLMSIKENGGKLKLACPDGHVCKKLRILNLLGATMFDSCKTEEEALKKFSE